MKDLNVPISIGQIKIIGSATGKIVVVWKPQEMLAGIHYSGTGLARVQSQVLM